jgi:hypothetical protein
MEVKESSGSDKPDKKRRPCRRESCLAMKNDLNSLAKFLDVMIHREERR